MLAAARGGFINATDLADYLVKRGLPFRSAYKISGGIVADCIRSGYALDDYPLSKYKEFSELIEEDVYGEISLETCVNKRISEGGTSVASVEKQIKLVRNQLNCK